MVNGRTDNSDNTKYDKEGRMEGQLVERRKRL